MPCVTVILTVLTIFGALLTVYGLVRALVEARKQADEAALRIDKAKALADEEEAAHEAVAARHDADPSVDMSAENKPIYEEFERRYAEIDVKRPSMDSLPWLAMYESQRLVSLVLNSSRRDFAVAILGVLVSTVASVWSLWVK